MLVLFLLLRQYSHILGTETSERFSKAPFLRPTCHKYHQAVTKTHVNRGVALPRHARKMKNASKDPDVSPGSGAAACFLGQVT